VAGEVAKASRWAGCHPGLAFAKFADTWKPNPKDRIGGPEKRKFLEKIVDLTKGHTNKVGGGLYGEFLKRRQALFNTLQDQRWLIESKPLTTQWRLVSGLGIAHPFETGFVFDHTYGVPYLPGSSVKGAARAWAEEIWGKKDPYTLTIFGPEDGDLRQGAVVFFDAYPIQWPELEIDILNPHYKDYYEGRQPPGDWLSPEPTYFLTVKAGQPFLFAIATRPDGPEKEIEEKATDLVDKAWQVVMGAAQNLGLGGKTAVGYGYFE
jgi:CRISPR-associated protein Cmr6